MSFPADVRRDSKISLDNMDIPMPSRAASTRSGAITPMSLEEDGRHQVDVSILPHATKIMHRAK